MDIPQQLKDYINDNLQLIDGNQFNKLYDEYKYVAISELHILTEMLYSCGIFPDKIDLMEIPQGYATSDCRIEEIDCRCNNQLKLVCGYSFTDNTNLRKVYLPNNCITIRRNAFAGCSNLEFIHLGRQLETIEPFAFNSCISLKEIEFMGTVDQWKQVSKNITPSNLAKTIWKNVPCRKIKCIDGYTQLRV